jgi:hypothetical protein
MAALSMLMTWDDNIEFGNEETDYDFECIEQVRGPRDGLFVIVTDRCLL